MIRLEADRKTPVRVWVATAVAGVAGLAVGAFASLHLIRSGWLPEAGLGVPLVLIGPQLALAVAFALVAHRLASRRVAQSR